MKNRILLLLLILGIGFYETRANAQTNSTLVVGRIAAYGPNHTDRFFDVTYQNVERFFSNPQSLYVFKKNTFVPGQISDISQRTLCAGSFPDHLTKKYNQTSENLVARKNFWTVVALCLAGSEGLEPLVNNQINSMNKNDVPEAGQRFLYGTFQLDSMRSGGVPNGCAPSWKIHTGKTIDSRSWSVNGLKKNQFALDAMGDPKNQEFNLFCGVHELFRASISSEKCLSPFMNVTNGNNRFGPLRRKDSALIACVNTWGPRAFEAKNPGDLKAIIGENFKAVTEVFQPENQPLESKMPDQHEI